MNQPEEYEDPQPESMTSLCYSCTQYETCHEKKATVTSCNAYENRTEAYKTDEQRYNEEQARIDAETRRKLRERQHHGTGRPAGDINSPAFRTDGIVDGHSLATQLYIGLHYLPFFHRK